MIEKLLGHKQYYIYFEGGLGDVVLQYFKYTCMPYLKELKERQPDTYIKVILSTHNSTSGEIFRYHPYVDEVEQHIYATNHIEHLIPLLTAQGFKSLRDFIPGSTSAPGEYPLYLSDNDKTYIDSVIGTSSYVCVHPFAGKADFKAESIIDFRDLAERHEKVVIIGGDSIREFSGRAPISIKESFKYEHPRVVNLVNIANSRISTQIAMQAKYFIGTLSCYVCAAAFHGVPGTCYIPGWLNDDFTELVKSQGYTRINI